jgi:hypothetical protein
VVLKAVARVYEEKVPYTRLDRARVVVDNIE